MKTIRTIIRILTWIAVAAAATIWLAIAIERETRHQQCINHRRPAHECNTHQLDPTIGFQP